MSEKRSHFSDPRKQDIATFWKKGQNILFLDFHWFWQKKGRTFMWHLLLFDSTFHSCIKAHCLRTKICWSIEFHIVKKITKILKSHFLKKDCFQILFFKSHNSVSFELESSEKSHFTLNFSQIITLSVTLYRQSGTFSQSHTHFEKYVG